MLPFCKMKANRRNIPNSLVRRRLRVRPIQTRQEKPWPRTAPSKTPTPTTPAGKSWRDTGGQMPNTTWTRRAEAARGQPKPQHRENTQQNGTKHMGRAEAATQRNHTQNKAKHAGRAKAPTHGKYTQNREKKHGASRSPNTGKSHNRTGHNTWSEPKPQHRGKHTGRAEAPTQERAVEDPKYQPHGRTKTAQPEGEKKKGKQKQDKGNKKKKNKEGKGKQRKALEQRRERRREDAQTGRPREDAKMKAWLHGPITEMVRVSQKIP